MPVRSYMRYPPPHLDISPFLGRRAAEIRGVKRWLLNLLPLHLLLQLKFELITLRYRFAGRGHQRAFRGQRGLLVNIGSGPRGQPGWVNVEAMPMAGVNCVCDCRRGLPFDDASVEGIFTEHFFEHIDYTEEVPYFLAECRRVLVPGGVIRVIVPDGGRYLRAYATEGWEEISRLRTLAPDHFDRYTGCRYRTKMELVNEVFRQAYTHKFAYDAATLIQVMHDAGFSQVKEQAFGRSLNPRLVIDLESRAHESLYVEARK